MNRTLESKTKRLYFYCYYDDCFMISSYLINKFCEFHIYPTQIAGIDGFQFEVYVSSTDFVHDGDIIDDFCVGSYRFE